VRAVDPSLAFLAVARSALEQAGVAERLNVVSEIFADRAYTERGLLLSRTQAGAVLHDPATIADRVLAMVTEGAVISSGGQRVPTVIHSVCVHGDTPNAVAIAKVVREKLEKAEFSVKPFVVA